MRLRLWPRRDRYRYKFKKTGWKAAWPTLVVGLVSVTATVTVAHFTIDTNKDTTNRQIENSKQQFLNTQRASAYGKLISDRQATDEDVRNCQNILFNLDVVTASNQADAAALAARLGQERAATFGDASLIDVLSSDTMSKLATAVSSSEGQLVSVCLGFESEISFGAPGDKITTEAENKARTDLVKYGPATDSALKAFVAAAKQDLGN